MHVVCIKIRFIILKDVGFKPRDNYLCLNIALDSFPRLMTYRIGLKLIENLGFGINYSAENRVTRNA